MKRKSATCAIQISKGHTHKKPNRLGWGKRKKDRKEKEGKKKGEEVKRSPRETAQITSDAGRRRSPSPPSLMAVVRQEHTHTSLRLPFLFFLFIREELLSLCVSLSSSCDLPLCIEALTFAWLAFYIHPSLFLSTQHCAISHASVQSQGGLIHQTHKL